MRFQNSSAFLGSKLSALGLLFGAGSIAGNVAEATSIDPHTLRVDVHGTGPAVEEEVVAQVRAILGQAFADGIVESIVTLGYGFEGGFSACVKRIDWAPVGSLTGVGGQIHDIERDPRRTALNVQYAADCYDWEKL